MFLFLFDNGNIQQSLTVQPLEYSTNTKVSQRLWVKVDDTQILVFTDLLLLTQKSFNRHKGCQCY